MIGQKARLALVAHAHLVGIVLTGERSCREAGADLDPLDRIDAHQRRREIGIELAIDRRPKSGRDTLCNHFDDGAHRGPALADLVKIALEQARLLGVRTEEWIALDLIPIPARAVDLVDPHLNQRGTHPHSRHDLASDSAGSYPHRGLPRGLPAAAAVVADAVFRVIGVVGVAGPIFLLDIGIVFRALIDIVDRERNGRAGRHLGSGCVIHKYARENPDLIRLATLAGETRLAGPSLVEPGLDVALRQHDAGRAAVDDTADRRTMTLAKGRDTEEMTERIKRHERGRFECRRAANAGYVYRAICLPAKT